MDLKKLKKKTTNNKISSFQYAKIKSRETAPWKKSARPGNNFVQGDWCSCVNYLNEQSIAKIVAGELVFCEKCQNPIWLDTFSFIEEPEYLSIYYGENNNKWAIVNTWKIHYFIDLILEKYNDWAPTSKSFSKT